MEEHMLFHTTLRNIGLFITLTFGCLTYRNTFSKDKLNSILSILPIIFLSISFVLNFNILKNKNDKVKRYKIIPQLILIIQITILLYILNMLRN
jgi:hypothetical protein